MLSDEEFKGDVSAHEMRIELDEGVHRCLYFGRPGSSIYHFRISTWPGHLCISGDAGTFVFQRTEDMFKFFRGDDINPNYWEEKIEAESSFGGTRKFDVDELKNSIRHYIEDQDDEFKQEIEDDLIYFLDGEGEERCLYSVYDFSANGVDFSDFMVDLHPNQYRKFTSQYIWCIRAIVWAIAKYDKETDK